MEMKPGDSVRVKPGVLDPDFSVDIGGWQGRVREVHGVQLVDILWDSITLRQMGMDVIVKCENDNLDWRVMTLDQDAVEPAKPRDTEKDVEATALDLGYKMLDDPRWKDE